MSVHITKKTEVVAWSLAHCEYCQQVEAIRCEETTETVSFYFVPLSKSISKRGYCHFCNRPVAAFITNNVTPFANWKPQFGLGSLGEILGVEIVERRLSPHDDHRLHSFLIELESSLYLKRIPIYIGVIVGGSLSAILGGYGTLLLQYLECPVITDSRDAPLLVGFSFACTGFFLGGFLHYWLARRYLSNQGVRRVVKEFGVNAEQLESIAHAYCAPIQGAVRSIRNASVLKRS